MITLHLREEAHTPGSLQICQGTVESSFVHMLFAAEGLAVLQGWKLTRFSTKNLQRHKYHISGVPREKALELPVFISLQVICSRRYPRSRDGQLSQRYFWEVKAEGSNLARRTFESLLERPCTCHWNEFSSALDQ